MLHVDETIVAVASAPGSERGVVRLSGTGVRHCVSRFFRGDQRWYQTAVAVRSPGALDLPLGEVPCDLMVWPMVRSYTRQPTIELHTLGNDSVLGQVAAIACQNGARLAQPGEFTMRAFLAGRLDLAQVEAVLGVIDAADGRALETALRQLAGGLSGPLHGLRDQLLNLCADLEAGLDFVDEDITFISSAQVVNILQEAFRIVGQTQLQMTLRGISEDQPRVVFRGAPNAGKSSLWNRLVSDANAIVTDQSGTTRDYLIGNVTSGEIPFLLVDTAGVESLHDDLSQSMQQHTMTQVASADLVLFCIPADRPLMAWEQTELASISADHCLVVGTKWDARDRPSISPDVCTSAVTGTGIQELVSACVSRLRNFATGSAVASTATRCRASLDQAATAITKAMTIAHQGSGDELVAAEIRVALDHLGQVVGAVYTEDVLDRVFSRFCIGK